MRWARWVAGKSRYAAIRAWRSGTARLTYALAAGDVACQVVERIPGSAPAGAKCCVFVHFDAQGRVWPHTRRYLMALIEAGLAITFVTNSPVLCVESQKWLEGRCTTILRRRNRGYDFGAYRDGIAELQATPELLVLANDSLYGPFGGLDQIFAQIDFTKADVWALTDSWQHRFHLQTFFVVFGPASLSNPGFTEFWQNVRNLRSKWAAVKYYELRMTAQLQAAGLRCSAVWSYVDLVDAMQTLHESPTPDANLGLREAALRSLAQRLIWCADRRIPMNPANDLWLVLLMRGFPFVKRELLRQNPAHTPNLLVWHQVARELSVDGHREVVEDLQRALRNKTP